MSDLVERLRMIIGTQFTPIETALVTEAADKLEAMQAALDPLALLAGGDVNMNDPLSKWFTIAQLHDAKEALNLNRERG